MTFPWPELEAASAVAAGSLQRLSTSVAVARGLATCGRAIDLGGLECLAGLLCAQVMDLEPEDGRAFRPNLVALEQEMAGLMETLRSTLP